MIHAIVEFSETRCRLPYIIHQIEIATIIRMIFFSVVSPSGPRGRYDKLGNWIILSRAARNIRSRRSPACLSPDKEDETCARTTTPRDDNNKKQRRSRYARVHVYIYIHAEKRYKGRWRRLRRRTVTRGRLFCRYQTVSFRPSARRELFTALTSECFAPRPRRNRLVPSRDLV